MTDAPLGAPYEPNNAGSDFTSILPGAIQEHLLDVNGDVDRIVFWQQPNRAGTFTVTPGPGMASQTHQWKLDIYSQQSGGGLVLLPGKSTTMGPTAVTIAGLDTPASTTAGQGYWLVVSAINGGFYGGPSTYLVSTTDAPLGAPYEPNNAGSDFTSILPGAIQEHLLDVNGDVDRIVFWQQPNRAGTFTVTPGPGTASQTHQWKLDIYSQQSGGGLVWLPGKSTTMGPAAVTISGLDTPASTAAGQGYWLVVSAINAGFFGTASTYRVSTTDAVAPPPCTFGGLTAVGTPIAGEPDDLVPVPRYRGRCAIQADEIGDYLIDSSPEDEDRYNARFYYYTGDRTGGNTDIFQARSATAQIIRVLHDGINLRFIASGSSSIRAVPVVANKWYAVSLNWSAGAGNGELRISVVGAGSSLANTPAPISNLFNSTDRIESAWFGLISGAGTGKASFDELEARRQTTPVLRCRGDANNDNYVSSADRIKITNEIAAGGNPISAGQPDANEDGTVNSADIDEVTNLLLAGYVCPGA
jgi:hypothetical protein